MVADVRRMNELIGRRRGNRWRVTPHTHTYVVVMGIINRLIRLVPTTSLSISPATHHIKYRHAWND